jgi:hypothetical protein
MQAQTAERRASFRERTMLGGLIATDAKSSKVSCVVRNLSNAGATVEFQTMGTMPERINLAIAKNGRAHTAKIVWFRGTRAGLAFDSQHVAADSADFNPDMEERLRIAEKKARMLKRRVRELSGEG